MEKKNIEMNTAQGMDVAALMATLQAMGPEALAKLMQAAAAAGNAGPENEAGAKADAGNGGGNAFAKIASGDTSEVTAAEDFEKKELYQAIYGIGDEDKRDDVIHRLDGMAKQIGKTDLQRYFRKKCRNAEKERRDAEERRRREEMKKAREGVVRGMTNYTKLPECCPGNMYCGAQWVATDDGVYKVDERRGMVQACSHPVLVAGMMQSIDSELDGIGEQKVQLAFKAGGVWKKITVEKNILSSATRVIQLYNYGVSVTSENAHAFVEFVQSMLDESLERGVVPVTPSTSRLGWTDEWAFLPYDGEVGFDKERDFPNLMKALKEHGDREAWFDAYKKMRATRQKHFAFATAAALAAPIVGMMQTEGFLCNIYGLSGGGKSVTCKIATTIWGSCKSRDNLVYSAANTQNSIEATLGTLCNLPLFVDDFNNMNKKEQKEFQAVIMKVANGIGRGRATRTMGMQKMKSWNTCALINSVDSITKDCENGGSVNRVLLCKAPDVFPWTIDGENAAGKMMAFFNANYGFAGRDFVKALQEMGVDAVTDMVEDFSRKIRKEAGAQNKSDRQIAPVAIMLTADRIAAEKLFCDGITISIEDAVAWMEDADTVNQYKRFYETLQSEVVVHSAKFEGLVELEEGQRMGEYWGMTKVEDQKELLCIDPHALKKIADENGVDLRMFYDWLDAQGLLLRGKDGKTTRVVRSQYLGKPVRLVSIAMPIMGCDDGSDTVAPTETLTIEEVQDIFGGQFVAA